MTIFNNYVDGTYISKLREGDMVELLMVDQSVVKAFVFVWKKTDLLTGKVIDKETIFTSENRESVYVIQKGRGLEGRVLHRYIVGWRKLPKRPIDPYSSPMQKRRKFKDRFGLNTSILGRYCKKSNNSLASRTGLVMTTGAESLSKVAETYAASMFFGA